MKIKTPRIGHLVPSTNLVNPSVYVPDPTKIKHLFGWMQVTQAPRREVVTVPVIGFCRNAVAALRGAEVEFTGTRVALYADKSGATMTSPLSLDPAIAELAPR